MALRRTMLAATAAVLATACANAGGSAEDGSGAELSTALVGLCRAAEQAAAGDFGEARATFEDRSHRFLHRLAAEVGEAHPGGATRLLELKARVEVALGPGGRPADAAPLLVKLEVAMREAAATVGEEAGRCGEAR